MPVGAVSASANWPTGRRNFKPDGIRLSFWRKPESKETSNPLDAGLRRSDLFSG
jgi:hypothetical protein